MGRNAKNLFTSKEDMKMWRFAMEKNLQNGMLLWNLFQVERGSTRPALGLYSRFRNVLIPHLPQTLFHTETKLKLCVQYEIRVDDEFLKALEEDAIVAVDNDGTVRAYTMKPNVKPNTDMELDDEEFLKLTCPILKKWSRFTEEEDTEIWNYFIKHHRRYTRGSSTFWKDLVSEKEWNRSPNVICTRFNTSLAPQLHKTDFDMKTKLMVYECCKFPVDRKYLKTLKKFYDLEVDNRRCIISYEKIRERRRRRASDEDEDEDEHVIKRSRVASEARIVHPVDIINRAQERQDNNNSLELKDLKIEEPDEIFHDLEIPVEDDSEPEPEQPPTNDIVSVMTNVMQGLMNTAAEQMRRELSKMSERISQVSSEVSIIRKQISNGQKSESGQEQIPIPNKKEYLLKLKNLVSSFNSPDLEDIQQKIDAAIDAVPEEDEDSTAVRLIRGSLDATLLMFGQ